ncbi:hypothetical protein NW762_008233 [Fusarium torreyae]|uniref:AB hydrolase-1 domain-containing protein n=1 Tax=Fusarium torreyae TaxID=1237075 RepID=A0A9W8VCB3_9HYPO|nr:hypothetical protein NW762_008233 [Fusarium torreyae]
MSSTLESASYGARIIGNPNTPQPLIICFHGSGDSCASWEPLANLLSTSYRVLLWDRRDPDMKPDIAVERMLEYLDGNKIPVPYVLVAHSYGGTFARLFLERRPQQLAGMVLVETGQETAIDPEIEQRQYKAQILGIKPLVVIRGNTLIAKWKQYEQALAAEGNATNPTLMIQKQLLDATDKEDERLKKAQLQLSRNNRYVHIPDCGHGVIRDRPDIVKEAVCWVMENQQARNDEEQKIEVQVNEEQEDKDVVKKSIRTRLREARKAPMVGNITRFLGR